MDYRLVNQFRANFHSIFTIRKVKKSINMSEWSPIRSHEKVELSAAILHLHHAAHTIASTAEAILPPKDDDSHTNLGWDPHLQALLSHSFDDQCKLGLLYPSFSLGLIVEDEVQTSLALAGKTRAAVYDWIRTNLSNLGFDTAAIQAMTRYEIPPHPVTTGGTFSSPSEIILEELTVRRNNAHHLFVDIAPEYSYASDVRTWPHHFDTGLYIPIRKNDAQEDLNSIGLGMAPPDGSVNDMYLYVTHWSKSPVKLPAQLPELNGKGYWVNQNWTGAVLPFSTITALQHKQQQQDIVQDFIQSAIKASLQLIGE